VLASSVANDLGMDYEIAVVIERLILWHSDFTPGVLIVYE
jgi:hypothetical protein